MTNKKFVEELNEFLKLVNELNFNRLGNKNIIYSFGGINSTQVLSKDIRDEVNSLIENLKIKKLSQILQNKDKLSSYFNTLYVMGEISEDELNGLNKKLTKLVTKFSGEMK